MFSVRAAMGSMKTESRKHMFCILIYVGCRLIEYEIQSEL